MKFWQAVGNIFKFIFLAIWKVIKFIFLSIFIIFSYLFKSVIGKVITSVLATIIILLLIYAFIRYGLIGLISV